MNAPTMKYVDRDTWIHACDIANVEPYEVYPYDARNAAVGIQCPTFKEYTNFMIELTTADADLAVNMNDVVRHDQLGFGQVFFFPGYAIGDEEEAAMEDERNADN